jgi:hypothetical protein
MYNETDTNNDSGTKRNVSDSLKDEIVRSNQMVRERRRRRKRGTGKSGCLALLMGIVVIYVCLIGARHIPSQVHRRLIKPPEISVEEAPVEEYADPDRLVAGSLDKERFEDAFQDAFRELYSERALAIGLGGAAYEIEILYRGFNTLDDAASVLKDDFSGRLSSFDNAIVTGFGSPGDPQGRKFHHKIMLTAPIKYKVMDIDNRRLYSGIVAVLYLTEGDWYTQFWIEFGPNRILV